MHQPSLQQGPLPERAPSSVRGVLPTSQEPVHEARASADAPFYDAIDKILRARAALLGDA